jgi:hypothetical protein
MSENEPVRNLVQTLHNATLSCLDAMARLVGKHVGPTDPEPEALADLRHAVKMLPEVGPDPFMASSLADLPPEGTSWHDWVHQRAQDWAQRLTTNLAQPQRQEDGRWQRLPSMEYEPGTIKARLLAEINWANKEQQAAVRRRKPSPVQRDRMTEARNKWIYNQCCKKIPHDNIVAALKKLAAKHGWKVVSTKQRIHQIGNEYADAHGLDHPPSRQDL